MLGKEQIVKAVRDKEIIIDPFNKELIDEVTYNVRLGNIIQIPKEHQFIDLQKLIDGEYGEVKIGTEGFVLEPKMFVLGKTFELITLSSKLGAILDGRTTLAKLGISIYQASNFCDPGRSTQLTLEIFNAGVFRVKLYTGMKIGSLVFFRVGD